MTIAFIINSFNRVSLLKNAIAAIESWYDPETFPYKIEFVVFDAGSTDGTIEFCKSYRHSYLSMNLLSPENGDRSFAAGLNAGCAFAISHFPHLAYLMFYETDNAIYSAASIIKSIKVMEHNPQLAACGYTVKKYSGADAGLGSPFPTVTNFILGKKLIHKLKLEAVKLAWQQTDAGIEFSYVDVVYTSPLLVNPSIWVKTGGLDEKQFPFSDCDLDWAKRVVNMGFRTAVVATGDVFHDNRETLSNWSKTRALSWHRGRLRYLKTHNRPWVYFAWPLLLIARHSMEYLGSFLLTDKEKSSRYRYQSRQLMVKCFNGYR